MMHSENIWSGLEGQAVVIESGPGHRRAGIVTRVTVDDVGLATAHLSRAIRVIDEDWRGPRRGAYRWCGELRITAGPHLVVMPLSEWWGEYQLPACREDVVMELEEEGEGES